MFCEKSGNCELQALAYRFGITAPRFAFQFPNREVDASHPDILIDHNRCILCARCVRASRDLDGKDVFGFVGRGRAQAHRGQLGGAAGRHRRRRDRPGARRLPGGRAAAASASASRCPSASGSTTTTPDRRRQIEHAGGQEGRHEPSPRSRRRRCAAASAATCRSSTSTSGSCSSSSWSSSTSRRSTTSRSSPGRCAVGLIEGGCCQRGERRTCCSDFREHCDVLVSVGDCATMGGIPALRNTIPLEECLRRGLSSTGPSVLQPGGRIPDDPEIPLLLDKVYPATRWSRSTTTCPGCPPSADTLWAGAHGAARRTSRSSCPTS
ncbi:MAG: ferredoxin [Anaerotruncus sp.]|nr:ferredoxin [Anaerotruncus sp.]